MTITRGQPEDRRANAIERELQAREREREAVALRRQGLAYDQIADRLGYRGESGAREAVKRALARIADPEVELLREIESNRITDLMARCYEELGREHVVAQFGKVVLNPATGEPLRDSGAVVTLIREIRQLSSELSKLRGLHAPQRVLVEEVTQDMVEAEIARVEAMANNLAAELGEQGIVVDAEKSGGEADTPS